MSNHDNHVNNASETPEPPQWLDDVLKIAFEPSGSSDLGFDWKPESESFRQRYQAAAELAANVVRLRAERCRIGFVPVSLSEYVRGLMKVANVNATDVFAWLGLEDSFALTSKSIGKLAQLALQIGISLREVLIHVRIGFVEKIDPVPVSLLLAHHRSSGIRDQLSECEVVLAQVEAKYDTEWLGELRRAEFEIRTTYKK